MEIVVKKKDGRKPLVVYTLEIPMTFEEFLTEIYRVGYKLDAEYGDRGKKK